MGRTVALSRAPIVAIPQLHPNSSSGRHLRDTRGTLADEGCPSAPSPSVFRFVIAPFVRARIIAK